MSDKTKLDDIVLWSVPDSHANYLFYAYPQIDRLLEIHKTLGGTGPGRRHNLEVVNKSAIVMICAFWEAFVEDLTGEALYHFAENARTAKDLPITLRKSVLKDLKTKKHELAFWDLADSQWRDLLRDRANQITNITDRTLSSPSAQKVEDFFAEQAGIDKISSSWKWKGTSAKIACSKLDAFIALRNAIAHRGGPKDTPVTKRDAMSGMTLIDRLIDASIGKVDAALANATGVHLIERVSLSDFPSG